MVLEDNEKTLKLLMENSKGKGSTEEESLDQEDQRIQSIELEKLEEPTEENASIVCGDWMHRIKPVIKKSIEEIFKVLDKTRRRCRRKVQDLLDVKAS
jgi:hypothetical protein